MHVEACVVQSRVDVDNWRKMPVFILDGQIDLAGECPHTLIFVMFADVAVYFYSVWANESVNA